MSLWSTLFTEACDASEKLGGIDYRAITVSANFKLPFWRDLILACGIVDASRSSVAGIIQRGISPLIVVGGALEALDARPGSVNLTLKRRKGFIRMALRHGCPLVPVYAFGENELFDQVGVASRGQSRPVAARALAA